jgi:hypothetical protein
MVANSPHSPFFLLERELIGCQRGTWLGTSASLTARRGNEVEFLQWGMSKVRFITSNFTVRNDCLFSLHSPLSLSLSLSLSVSLCLSLPLSFLFSSLSLVILGFELRVLCLVRFLPHDSP